MDYENFEHVADIGVRGFGSSVEEAFCNGAKAMFNVMIDVKKVDAFKKIIFKCDAIDLEALFVEWLNKLLSESSLKRMVFSKFQVRIKDIDDRKYLEGIAWGEKLDKKKHKVKIEVKAATYSNLKVKKVDSKFIAQCIVDV